MGEKGEKGNTGQKGETGEMGEYGRQGMPGMRVSMVWLERERERGGGGESNICELHSSILTTCTSMFCFSNVYAHTSCIQRW